MIRRSRKIKRGRSRIAAAAAAAGLEVDVVEEAAGGGEAEEVGEDEVVDEGSKRVRMVGT